MERPGTRNAQEFTVRKGLRTFDLAHNSTRIKEQVVELDLTTTAGQK